MNALPDASAARSRPVGFADPVHGSQAMFRILLEAMARPGTVHPVTGADVGDAPLAPAVAAVLLTLADHETTVWLDPTLPRRAEVVAWLKFSTGARLNDDMAAAAFALVAGAARLPPLSRFSQGTPEYPDRSTTVIVPVDGFGDAASAADHTEGHGITLAGPGIVGTIGFATVPAVSALGDELAANRTRFPQGVDLVFCAPSAVAAIPRSSRVVRNQSGGR